MKRHFIYLTAALVFAVGFLAIADEPREQELFRADHQLEQMVRTVRGPALEPAMRALSTIGSGYVLIPLSVALGMLLWRRAADLVLALPVLGAGVGIIEGAGKWLVHRPRPRGHAYGFPSGHAIAATVFFAFLVYVVWTVRLHPAPCWVVTILAVLLIVGVAASRVYLHAHWFSDVLGGAFAGAAYVCVVVWCIERRSRRTPVSLLTGRARIARPPLTRAASPTHRCRSSSCVAPIAPLPVAGHTGRRITGGGFIAQPEDGVRKETIQVIRVHESWFARIFW